MPRYTSYYPAELANLKKDTSDIIHDFKIIASTILDTYQDELNDETINELIDIINRCTDLFPSRLEYVNRIYITTDVHYTSFMLVNLEKHIFDNFLRLCDICYPEQYNFFDASDFELPCLWIFENKELIRKAFIPTRIAMELSSVFYKENLVNYGSIFRSSWTVKPRRNSPRMRNK